MPNTKIDQTLKDKLESHISFLKLSTESKLEEIKSKLMMELENLVKNAQEDYLNLQLQLLDNSNTIHSVDLNRPIEMERTVSYESLNQMVSEDANEEDQDLCTIHDVFEFDEKLNSVKPTRPFIPIIDEKEEDLRLNDYSVSQLLSSSLPIQVPLNNRNQQSTNVLDSSQKKDVFVAPHVFSLQQTDPTEFLGSSFPKRKKFNII